MGLCANDTKRRRPFKTIIIPRGIINPNEHNVIEIPLNLDATSSLIVRAPTDANSCFSVEPYRGSTVAPPAHSTPQPEVFVPVAPSAPCAMPTLISPCALPTIRSNSSQDRSRKVDFGCQTMERCWERGTQSESMQDRGLRQVLQDPHSPLCPICARASCKFLSSGLNRPYCRFGPAFPQSDTPNASGLPYSFPRPSIPTLNVPVRVPHLPPAPYEPPRSGYRLDNEALSRMLDEKIERILKPVLCSLARLSPEEEDREKYLGSTGLCKPSSSSINPRLSRDFVRRYDDGSKLDVPDYEDFRRDLRKREVDFGGPVRTQFRNPDFDFEDSRKRSMGADRDECPTSASCQRRPGVSFDDGGSRSTNLRLNEMRMDQSLNGRMDPSEKSHESLLKKL